MDDKETNATQQLYKSGMEYITTIVSVEKEIEKTVVALSRLAKSPDMRNVLMGLPATMQPQVSLRSVLGLHCEVNPGEPISWISGLEDLSSQGEGNFEELVQGAMATARRKRKRDSNYHRKTARLRREEVARMIFDDGAISLQCQRRFPNISLHGVLGESFFLVGVLGQSTLDEGGHGLVTMAVIFSRLEKIEDNIKDGWDMRSLTELSQSWVPSNPDKILIRIENEWHQHVMTDLSKGGYIDVQAGVTFPGCRKPTRPQSSHNSEAHGRIIKLQGESLGGVIDWTRGCFSPEFLQYFNEDVVETLGFSPDPSSPNRYIRCESPYASKRSPPIYFQLGSTPKAVLFQATESTKFGDHVLKICNYVEQIRHHFFFDRMRFYFGTWQAAECHTPPKKEYDLVFVTAAMGKSFSWHTDARFMLCDEERLDGWWKEKYMRVMTLFFFDDKISDVHLKYRQRGTCNGPQCSVTLGPNGMHEQGYYTQAKLEHSVQCKASMMCRRYVWTARSTRPLQDSGLTRLQQRQEHIDILGERYNVYFSRDGMPLHPRPMGSPMAGQLSPSSYLANTSSLLLGGTTNSTANSITVGDVPDIRSKIRYPKNTDTSSIIGVATSKLVEVSECITSLLSGREGFGVLLQNKLRLVVSSNGQSIPFGPCPDFNKSLEVFASIGQSFPCDSVRQYFCLLNTSQQQPPWSSKTANLGALFLTKRYKSPLDSKGDPDNVSPLHELGRILSQKDREGFSFYLSGGNSVSASSHGPTVDRASVVSYYGSTGVALRTPQSMSIQSNPRNVALIEASVRERVVSVFLSEQNLPRALQKSADGQNMCIYAGMYHMEMVRFAGQLTGEVVKGQLAEAREGAGFEDWGGLDPIEVENLNFLRAPHMRCKLLPIPEGPQGGEPVGSWKDLLASTDDKQRLCFEVPRSFSAANLATSDIPSVTELIQAYLSQKDGFDDVFDDGVDDGVNGVDSVPNDRHANILLCDVRRTKYDAKEVNDILKGILLACTMRYLRLNVNEEGMLSPLHDIRSCDILGPTNVTAYSSSYGKVFGDGRFPFCAALGTNVLLNPYPSPLPSFDSKTVYLQRCNLGSHATFEQARNARNGGAYINNNRDEAAGLLLQCIITEITGNPIANSLWWDTYKKHVNDDGVACSPRLPSTPTMCNHYLAFLEACASVNRRGFLTDFLQHHYRLQEKLRHIDSYKPILTQLSVGARPFIDKIVDNFFEDEGDDKRQKILDGLNSFLASCINGVETPFLASKVLANMEELVSGEPFGAVRQVPLGPGALNGIRLLDWEAALLFCRTHSLGCSLDESITKISCQNNPRHACDVMLCIITTLVKELGDDWFGWLYYNEATGKVHQRSNGRELNAVDAEHLLCKLYIFREHEPGGGRSMTVTPHLQQPHCFPNPVVGTQWLGDLPEQCLHKFRLAYMRAGIQFISLNARVQEVVESGCLATTRQAITYVNPYVTRHPLVPHPYHTKTFARRESWEQELQRLQPSIPSNCRMRVFEDRSTGLQQDEVHFYEDFPALKCITDAVAQVVQSYEWHGFQYPFADTFTLHSQSKDSVGDLTAYYYHIDKRAPFALGRIMILPVQCDSFFFVSSPDTAVKLKDDSSLEFKEWKDGLRGRDAKDVDDFVADLKQYAAERGQPVLNVYKLQPGKAICFDSTSLVHGSIIPRQEQPRMILICHRLELQ